jgi:dTDP-4-amino-4,6-dideoxygalactose transaminase
VLAARRDDVAAGLAARGIASAVYYPLPLHRQPAYAGFPRAADLSVAVQHARAAISLPVHADLEPADQACIIATISALAGQKRA